MFKIIILTLVLVGIVSSETNLQILPKNYKLASPKSGEEISRPAGFIASRNTFYIPNDNGGNWGDNLWKNRESEDSLLLREIQINNSTTNEQQFNWSGTFTNKSLTHIRFLNIGRERAYVERISSSGETTANAVILIGANQQFRLLIEVYGK